MTTLYTIWSLYTTFTMIYYIRQEQFCKIFSSLSFSRENSPESLTETHKVLFFHLTSKWGKW